jgi:sugar O-acyltransferase (sialic acid O-acetyltransferase NeuD family)
MDKVILFGNSVATKMIFFALSHDPRYEVVAFTVDRSYITGETFCGLPVHPFEDIQTLFPPESYKMMVAIQASRMNKTRAEKYDQAKEKGYSLITYIHPQAIVAPDLVIGDNCFIGEGAICRPYAKIENDVIIMPGALIGHDAAIKEHSFVGVRAVIMSVVTIEPYCFIGPNATILEALTVARECLIGGGVVIQEATKEKEVYKATAPTRLPLPSDKLANIIFRKTHD